MPVRAASSPYPAPASAGSATRSLPGQELGGLWHACLDLAKPRLTSLVLVAAGLGYVIPTPAEKLHLGVLFLTVVGTGLVGAAASALNQLREGGFDALMVRTRERPVPSERIGPTGCVVYALLCGAGGGAILMAIHWLAAALALASLAIYVGVYTPLKRRTTLNTVVGAVPGALPPLIGWAAATGTLDAGAWSLFAIVFLWQIPHFLAIAWRHRADYARAGFRMLPVIDPSGRSTTRMVIIYQVALLGVSVTPALTGLAGFGYLLGAVGGSLGFLVAGVRFQRRPDEPRARTLFLTSLLYLPLLLALMVLDPAPVPEVADPVIISVAPDQIVLPR